MKPNKVFNKLYHFKWFLISSHSFYMCSYSIVFNLILLLQMFYYFICAENGMIPPLVYIFSMCMFFLSQLFSVATKYCCSVLLSVVVIFFSTGPRREVRGPIGGPWRMRQGALLQHHSPSSRPRSQRGDLRTDDRKRVLANSCN